MVTVRKRYSYRYITEAKFAPAVEYHFFKLRAVPCENNCQKIIELHLNISPECKWNASVDGFGNIVQYGGFSYLHSSFKVESTGIIECTKYELPDENPEDIYSFPTHLTTCNDEMKQWAELNTRNNPADLAEELMHHVFIHMQYQRFETNNSTTAIEVYDKGKGVCQDYAHLMIAVCRYVGLKARYVNGFMLGEGETHAWVEVHDGKCWYGYDPTHDSKIDFGYVKLAHGRDASDCPSNRGRIYSWTNEQLNVISELKQQ